MKKTTESIKNLVTFVNKKLGGQIGQLNMPYALSCRPDAPCYKECYCTHGNIAFSSVRQSHIAKYELYKANPKGFFNKIDAELQMLNCKYFRFHASGDIVDAEYLNLMCWLARRHKETHFLCFTKKYELVNEYLNSHRKPSNLILVLSSWGDWIPENPHNLPTSWVGWGDERDQNIPLFAYECPGSCADCPGTHCWHMRKGDSVIFHKH